MAYINNIWKDREGTTRYFETTDTDGAKIFTPNYDEVTELGTPVNADHMNHIEEGIAATDLHKYSTTETFQKDEWVTAIIDGEKKIYQSLKDNNQEKAVTDTEWWQEVSFGGSGSNGLEIGDIGFSLYVDETKGTRRILNGSILLINEASQNFVDWLKDLKLLHPEYFKTEEEWQATKTLSPEGIVNAFVLDETAGTIRLMSYPDYFVGGLAVGATAPVKGNDMTLGITTGNNQFFGFVRHWDTGSSTVVSMDNRVYGTPVGTNAGSSMGTTGGWPSIGVTSDATKSGLVADLSGLGTEKINGYYFIQINTGVTETNKPINNYTVNNPYSYGMFQYLPEGTYNPSWLKSINTYYTKAVYTDLYNWVLANYNAEKEGFKASTATDITDYDWVINLTDETFRLPLKTELESNQIPQGWALYFYCGDTLQNVDLMNVARMEESIADVNRGYLVEKYTNGKSWYRVYSDGWIEQGGYANGNGVSIVLLKKMMNINYSIILGGGNSSGWGNNSHSFTFYNVSANGFNIKMEEGSSLSAGMNCNWLVVGYKE